MGDAQIGTRKEWFRVDDLVLDEPRFQDRNPNAAGYGQAYKQKGRSEHHIRAMVDAIENTRNREVWQYVMYCGALPQ